MCLINLFLTKFSMADKKQKIHAREYFNGSVLFTADVLAGMDNSATSSSAEYELTCKKCGAEFTRKGNAKNLRTCAGCKRTWDRSDNVIKEYVKKTLVKKAAEVVEIVPPRKSARLAKLNVEESEEESEEEIPKVESEEEIPKVASKTGVPKKVKESEEENPLPKAKKFKMPIESEDDDDDDDIPGKKLPDHDVDILLRVLKGEVEPIKAKPKKTLKNKAPVKEEEENWVEEILDYYDDYADGEWQRVYYVKWWGSNENTFITVDDFSDSTLVNKFEKSLPSSERFRNMFPNSKIKKLTGMEKIAYRTKADVENDAKQEEVPDEVKEPAREKVQVELVYLKAGHRYFDLKTSTLFLLEGDKGNDKIMLEII